MMPHAERVERYPSILLWHPASGAGTGKRSWFVLRERADSPRPEYYLDSGGKLVHLTMAGAYRKAQELNREAMQ